MYGLGFNADQVPVKMKSYYLEDHRVCFAPDSQWEGSDHAAPEAEQHCIIGLHLDGNKDAHKPCGSKTAPENCRIVCAIRLGEVKMALNTEGCNVEPVADLHANVKHVDETDENDEHPLER